MRTIFDMDPPPTEEELAGPDDRLLGLLPFRDRPRTKEEYIRWLERTQGPGAAIWAAWEILALAVRRGVSREDYDRLFTALWREVGPWAPTPAWVVHPEERDEILRVWY